ncbi:MAG TPA: NADPH-dependent FMN reductase [Herpetosiphonaceae bacterium]
MAAADRRIHIVGIGGTLQERSTSRWALERALQAAAAAGATTELLALYELDLPMFVPGRPLESYVPSVARMLEAVRSADALILSTVGYHGTLAGATKNALDFFEFLSKDERPYIHEKVVGLIATAAGELAAVNAINPLVHAVHALRGTVAPLFVPIPRPGEVFDAQGNVVDPKWAGRLDQLGRLVAETASKFQPTPIDTASL